MSFRILNQVQEFFWITPSTIRLFSLLLPFGLCAHMMSCLLFLVGISNEDFDCKLSQSPVAYKYRHSLNFNTTIPREHARLLPCVLWNHCQQFSRLRLWSLTRACKSGSSMLGGRPCQWKKSFVAYTKNSFIFNNWEKYHHRFPNWFTVHSVHVLGCYYHDHRWIRCAHL